MQDEVNQDYSEQNEVDGMKKGAAEPLNNTPLVHWTLPAATLRRISMKALARYQVILLGEQRHIRCEQLAQGCCPNRAAVGVEPATSRSRVQRSNHYSTKPPKYTSQIHLHL